MGDFLTANTYFGIGITVSAFAAGRAMQAKWKSPACNPILIATLAVALVLLSTGIPVDTYQESCAPLQYLLTPATICYAVSLHEQITRLQKNLLAILTGVICGTLVSLFSIRLMCSVFGLGEVLTVSLLPKSITTAIGMPLSQEAGGIPALPQQLSLFREFWEICLVLLCVKSLEFTTPSLKAFPSVPLPTLSEQQEPQNCAH